ncbi:hypothetical protein C8J57DRAFT_235927 [Mycena rebaudengoi]|nr:hypothetical protein C8J57DRAFT_235927 [Mycena rebaudengoi]
MTPSARYNTDGLSEEQLAVLAVAETFLSGIRLRDKALMLTQVLPEGGATLLRNGAPLHMTLAGVVERLPFDWPQKMSEPIVGTPVVLIDRDLAMAWTPYEFWMDGFLDHVGTDIWSFVKQNGRWIISGLADNTRKPDE